MRPASIVTFALILGACSARPVTSDDQTSSTATDDEGDGDATTETESGADLPSTSGDGDGDGDGDLADPCGCEDGQLCVGDCIWGDFNPDSVQNDRCVDATVCDENGWDSPPCMQVACARAPWGPPMRSCGPPGESDGYDIICDPTLGSPCDAIAQDCPFDEKCVVMIPDRWEATQCVVVVGTGAAGEPCTSEGAAAFAGTDSCDDTSMCWNGSLSAEPFEGVCQPFCSPDLSCPDPMSCEQVTEDFQLCMPSP